MYIGSYLQFEKEPLPEEPKKKQALEEKLAVIDHQIKTLDGIDWSSPSSLKNKNAFNILTKEFKTPDVQSRVKDKSRSEGIVSLKLQVRDTIQSLHSTRKQIQADLQQFKGDQKDTEVISLKRQRSEINEPSSSKKQKITSSEQSQARGIKRQRDDSYSESEFEAEAASQSKRQRISSQCDELIDYFNFQPSDIQPLLDALLKFPEDQRQVVVQLALDYLPKGETAKNVISFLEVIQKVPVKKREQICHLAKPFMERIDSRIDSLKNVSKFDILKEINAMIHTTREEVCLLAEPFTEGIYHSFGRLEILRGIQTVLPKERAEVCHFALPLIKGRTRDSSEVLAILKEVNDIPSKERQQICLLAQHFIEGTTRYGKNDIIKILQEIKSIPQADRDQILHLGSSLFKGTAVNSNVRELLWKTVTIIPEEGRESFIQKIGDRVHQIIGKGAFEERTLLLLYFLSDTVDLTRIVDDSAGGIDVSKYRDALLSSLTQKLSQELMPSVQLQAAEFVRKEAAWLQLHEEDPLVQHAVEIVAAQEVEEAKNPLSIYKKLKNLQQIPEDFKPVEQSVAGTIAVINMNGFQGISLQGIKREDLPADATAEAWQGLVYNLKTKVEGGNGHPGLPKKNVIVDTHERKEVAALWDTFGVSWTAIWEQSLQDPYLTGLLCLSDDKVSLTEAKFRAVVSNILSKDSNPRQGMAFTEQEEVLITTAMSIKNCPGGKREGIDGAYRDLEDTFHYQIKLPEDIQKEEEKRLAEEFVTSVIKNLIANQFHENSPLMKELTGAGSQEVQQGPHQSIYLKNLIGHLVGIDHELTYDQQTGVLYSSLISKSRKEVLTAFFKYVTPESMAKELIRVVNSDLRKYSTLVNPLISDSEFWDLDEEDFVTIRLNERGALKLLQEAGFLTSQ